MIRVPLPSHDQILETLLHICQKENINITYKKLNNIINNSDNKVNHAIWLLETYKYGIKYEKNWEVVIDLIANTIVDPSIQNNKKLYTVMKKIREQFYILFIM